MLQRTQGKRGLRALPPQTQHTISEIVSTYAAFAQEHAKRLYKEKQKKYNIMKKHRIDKISHDTLEQIRTKQEQATQSIVQALSIPADSYKLWTQRVLQHSEATLSLGGYTGANGSRSYVNRHPLFHKIDLILSPYVCIRMVHPSEAMRRAALPPIPRLVSVPLCSTGSNATSFTIPRGTVLLSYPMRLVWCSPPPDDSLNDVDHLAWSLAASHAKGNAFARWCCQVAHTARAWHNLPYRAPRDFETTRWANESNLLSSYITDPAHRKIMTPDAWRWSIAAVLFCSTVHGASETERLICPYLNAMVRHSFHPTTDLAVSDGETVEGVLLNLAAGVPNLFESYLHLVLLDDVPLLSGTEGDVFTRQYSDMDVRYDKGRDGWRAHYGWVPDWDAKPEGDSKSTFDPTTRLLGALEQYISDPRTQICSSMRLLSERDLP